MAHIAHQPGPMRIEGKVSRWLAGVVVLGGGAAPAPPLARARGALLQFECLRKTRGAGRPGLPVRPREVRLVGMAELPPLFPGGPGGEKPLLC
jgi:hypothetical protein